MTERVFMVYETENEAAEHYGRFETAEEAETVATRLGWRWVLVVRREVDKFGTVMDHTKRFYQPESVRMERKPGDVEALRRLVVPAPLSGSEARFFEEYERQMRNGKSKTSR